MRTEKIAIGLLSLFVVFSSSALATTIQRIGPDGGHVSRIIADPRNPDVLYAESGTALLKTFDGGDHWMTVYRSSYPYDSISGVFMDLSDSSILYAWIYSYQAGSSKFCKSMDGGAHWSILPNQPPAYEVTADPCRSGVLYATGDAAVFRTTDGGLSWMKIHQFQVPMGSDAVDCRILAIDPAHFDTIYMEVMITRWDGRDSETFHQIEKSENGGSSWMEIHLPGQDKYGPYWSMTLKFDPGDPGALYSIVLEGLFLSRDGGATWRKLWDGLSNEETVLDVAFGPVGSGLLYVGTYGGLFRSPDGGATWTNIGNGLPATGVGFIRVDPRDASSILVHAAWIGMFKTTDGGASWIFSSSGFRGSGTEGFAMAVAPGHPSTLYVATIGGLYKSANRGMTWDWLWVGKHTILNLAVHPQDSSILYADRTDGIAKSLDGGRTWNLLQAYRINLYDRTALVIDPVHPETVYAGDEEGPLYKTTDGGAHWITLNVPESVNCLAIDPANPAVLYAGLRYVHTQSADVSIYKSTDGGSTWAKRKIIDKERRGDISLALDPADPRTIFAGTCFGLYKSKDGGETWALVLPDPSGRGFEEEVAVAPSGPSVVYMLIGPSVFRSLDGGTRWEDISRGLNTNYFQKIVIDPSDSNNVYLTGRHTNGVYALREGLSWLAVNRARLNFGAVAGAPPTAAQRFKVINAGDGDIHWTAAADQSWIRVSPSGGVNGGDVQVSVDPQGLLPGSYSGSITVEDPQASNPPQTVVAVLKVYGGGGEGSLGLSGPPIGFFDTPADDSGKEGSIPLTGWALDDIQVANVEIWRDAVPGEGSGLVYIGDAVFVEDARPDVEERYFYSHYPFSWRAGWGYMLLTNFLPNQGNGTFVIHARATDAEGHIVELGTKTIVSDNAHAVKPFGTIDTPGQGGPAFGSAYVNFGWALTPLPNAIPSDGSTIWVWVDGVRLGNPVYGNYRTDIATFFPGYANSNGAVGYFSLDTTAYADGLHTIAWSVRDNNGNESGLGSRYFSIFNAQGGSTGGSSSESQAVSNIGRTSLRMEGVRPGRSRGQSLRGDSRLNGEMIAVWPQDGSPVSFLTGFSPEKLPEFAYPGRDGIIRAEMPEIGRIEIDLDPASATPAPGLPALIASRMRTAKPGGISAVLAPGFRPWASGEPKARPLTESGSSWSGFLLVGKELRPLPIGSTFDAAAGIFTWQAGPGFVGAYDLVFIRDGTSLKRVTITVGQTSGTKVFFK